MGAVREDLEGAIRSLYDAGELEQAATVAVRGYGPELLGYLTATLRSEQTADEVFAQVCEDLWRGLPEFSWRCSFRTWTYVLARNAAASFRRSPQNQAARRVPLSKISELVMEVRTRTRPHLRTDVKDRFAELRSSLDPEEQALLILRINRELSWNEIALVLDAASPDDEDAIRRGAAKLRQRFQALKKRLRERVAREGLLGDVESDA